MLPKDSKKNKSSYYKFSSFASKNKKLENNKPVNKLFNKIKSARSPLNDNKRNINNNIHLDVLITSKEKDTKKKIHTSRYNTKSNNEKSITKIDILTNQKTSNKINMTDKKAKINKLNPKKNSGLIENRKSPFVRSKTHYINDNKKNIINNDKKSKKQSSTEATKLLEILTALSPIDASRCSKLMSNNLNKIVELENQVKCLIAKAKDEVKTIKNKKKNNIDNNDENKINLEQNIEIIDKESNMRKEIYKLLFNFISDLLEEINKLSYSIANQEIIDLNNLPNDRNLLLNNGSSNASGTSNNSLFISEIQEEFCGRLINLTKSFINSDIDLSEIKFINNDDIKNNYQNIGKNFDDNLFNDDEDFDDYKNLLKYKSKKTTMMHPNEILNKIKNINEKDKKVVHHYSNSLKVNSNLEKLEEKENKDEENINIEQFGNIKSIIQGNNCIVF